MKKKFYVIFGILICFMQVRISYSQGEQGKDARFDIRSDKVKKSKNSYTRLWGNVSFSKVDLVITCDSAHYYEEEGRLIAYSHVKMKNNEGLTVTGDQLFYYKETKNAIVTGEVKMEDNDIILTTTELNYNLQTNSATYNKSADIISKSDGTTIYSIIGNYNAPNKVIHFNDSVLIHSESNIIESDSVDYFMETKKSILKGPSIITSEENRIYTEHGVYNDELNYAILDLNAVIYSENTILSADSIYYDKNTRIAKAYKNIHLEDTSSKVDGYGDYAIYNEINKTCILTDEPWIRQLSEKSKTNDSLRDVVYDTLYVHADSLKYINDSITKEIWGYQKVKMFKNDIQTMSDTLFFNQSDSVIHLIKNPVVWEKDNQIFGKQISIYFKNKKINNVKVSNGAFVASKPFKADTSAYNQVKGDSINAYFADNKLRKIYVYGTCLTRYYIYEEEDNNTIKKTGFNVTESSDIIVYAKEGDIDRINFTDTPDGKMMPLKDINPKLLYLDGFIWLDEHRPKKWKDIFKWTELKNDLIQ